jgi:hypothetical protein
MFDALAMIVSKVPFRSKERKALDEALKEFPYHVAFMIGRQKWYCYDELSHMSVGRSGQVNAIAAQAQLNITPDDLKYLSGIIRDMLDLPHTEMKSMQAEAGRILQAGLQATPPDQLKTLLKRMATVDMKPARVAESLLTELSKRMELLAHEEFLYRLAAVMFWCDGENPRLMLEPEQINKKVEFLKKKGENILLRLLMTPVANILYHLNQSDQDSVTSLMMALTIQKPFQKFSDMILTQENLKSSVSGTTPKDTLTEATWPHSDKQEEVRQNLKGGTSDL